MSWFAWLLIAVGAVLCAAVLLIAGFILWFRWRVPRSGDW